MWSHGYFNQNISDPHPNHDFATAALTFWNSEDVPDDEEDEDNEDSESEWTPSKGG